MSPLVRSEETDKTDEHNCSEDIERRLEAIQDNSAQQSLISKQEYLELIYLQRFFKIPVIVLSGINSVFAVGLNAYASQDAVSIINCILAFICATIGSIELYLNISKKIEISLSSFQSFYLLSIKIFHNPNCRSFRKRFKTFPVRSSRNKYKFCRDSGSDFVNNLPRF